MTHTVQSIRAHKNKDIPLVALTAYSTPMAKLLDPHVDIILVGDSMGMVLYGMDNTLGMTLPMMVAHGKAVRRGIKKAFMVVDMPYGSYEDSDGQALKTAQTIMKETGCHAVKLEGGQAMASRIQVLTDHNIPVMGHIGLLPQSVEKEGGYKIKKQVHEQDLLTDVAAIEDAGAFAFVLEGTVEDVAKTVTNAVTIPSIGIGASPACDGQILVTEDMLGLSGMAPPKFAKLYTDIGMYITQAVKTYASETRTRTFPAQEYTYR